MPGEEDRFYAELGRRVRVRRTQLRLSQESLATKLSLKRTSITNLEQGRQRISAFTLRKLARLLGMSAGDLLEQEGSSTELEHLFEPSMPTPCPM